MDDRRLGPADATRLAESPKGPVTHCITVDAAVADLDVTSGDNVQLMLIPAGCIILAVSARVETIEDSVLTVDVGLYIESTDAEVDKDGFLDGFNGAVAGVKMTNAEAYANHAIPVTAGWNLCATYNNAADKSKIHYFITLVEHYD